MQPREGQLHLGFDTGTTHYGEARRRVHQVTKQRRLADPRLAAKHQHRTLPGPHLTEQAVQCRTLAAAAPHLSSGAPRGALPCWREGRTDLTLISGDPMVRYKPTSRTRRR